MSKKQMELLKILRNEIDRLPPETKLPTVRALMDRFSTGPHTVQKVLQILAEQGRIVIKSGSGSYTAGQAVTSFSSSTAWQEAVLSTRYHPGDHLRELLTYAPEDCIPLQSGYAAFELQATAELQTSLKAVSRKPHLWGRTPTEGLEDLRAWFAQDIGPHFRATDVQIVSGGQAALAIVFSALTEPGQDVLVESPTYMGALAAIRSANLNPIPVPTDRHGIVPELLETTLRRGKANVLYIQPLHANPTGSTLAHTRRREVLELAERYNLFIVEDDYLRGLTFAGTAPKPLITENESHVIYLRSLTKSTAPSMRVAAIVARGVAKTRIHSMGVVEGLFVPRLLQETALHLLSSPQWPKHLKRCCHALELHRDLALEEIKRYAAFQPYLQPTGGFHMWVQLPEGISSEAFARTAERHRVMVSRGDMYFPAEPTGSFFRLSFGSVDSQTLRDGIYRLGQALDECVKNPM
ncbi:MAG: PLP-dependent aminotransferase family protein [Deinococcaceae bacterium]